MGTAKIYVGGLLALVLTNAATVYFIKKQVPIVSYDRRMAFALDAMKRIDGKFVVVLGDSITERSEMPATVCGSPLIKVGIGGSRSSFFIPFAEEMVASNIKPSVIAVELGSNDAHYPNFTASFKMLIDRLPKSTIILATPPPTASAAIETAIRSEAANRGIDIVDFRTVSQFRSDDGTHPDSKSSRAWVSSLVSRIGLALGCRS